MADGLLNKASIILTPTGYKAGTLYNVAPVVEPYEDFDFARASVASRVNSSGLVEMVGRTLGSNLVQNGDFSQLGSELVTSTSSTDNWINARANSVLSVVGDTVRATPHWLQYLLRDSFLKPHFGHACFILLEGMAINNPLEPSITFMFLTTKALSNVTVAYAFNFLSGESFKNILTSVISISLPPSKLNCSSNKCITIA